MKRFISFFCVIVICFGIMSSTAFADYTVQDHTTSSEAESSVQPRAEETEW